MATLAPAYLVDIDIDFNNQPTPCIFFSAINYYVAWKSLSNSDRAVFVDVIANEFADDPANVMSIETLSSISIPGTTNSFGRSYEYLIKFNAAVPAAAVTTTTSIYHAKTMIASAGRQGVQLSNDVIGATPTELVPGTYTVDVAVDGNAPINISLTDVEAATYDDLIIAINADLVGATTTLVNGAVSIVSISTGASSEIELSNDNLFFSLNGVIAVGEPSPGTDATSGGWFRLFDGGPA